MGSGDPLDLICEGREKLAAEDRSGWADVALSDRMLAVAVERERLEAEWVRLTAEWDARGAWGGDGYASASGWLAANARMSRPAAGRLLRSARHVHRFGRTGEALTDGTVTTDKIEILAEAARHREKFYERDEDLLLDAAARLEARDLTTAVRTWRMLADDEAADDDANDAFDRVHLDMANGLLGSELAGFLDPHGATVLANALDLIEPPDPTTGPDLPRKLSQRRGEGLVKLAQHYLDARMGSDTAGRAVASVAVVFTPEHDRWLLEDHRCELEGFGPVPRSTVARLACDARAAWLTLDGRHEVLNLGRDSRTVTAAQRRAVTVRDRHCRHPGCRAPARWCDVHHRVEWEHGGGTDMDNLVLLCRRHHVIVHEGRQRLLRNDDGTLRVAIRARRQRWNRGDPDG
jgi:hypothetical protein